MKRSLITFIIGILLGTLTACQTPETATPLGAFSVYPTSTVPVLPNSTPTSTPEPPRVLTICSQEPASLFLYGDTSSAARSVLQAIYDGPFDMVNYDLQPVILEKIPTIKDGDALLRPVEVLPGTLIVDDLGNWVSLDEDVRFRPSGCTEPSCAQTYDGIAPVEMDALVLEFRLITGLLWSDGTPLTAADSVYSFKVFQNLYRDVAPDAIRYTKSYTALDERTVEWVGIPGYVGTFATKFAPPLPKHQLGGIPDEALLTADTSSRTPMGWGPYTIDEWVDGDHITLNRSQNYYRATDGLPNFDHLVFRFMEDGDEAIDALAVGECDLIDLPLLTEADISRLEDEQEAGVLTYEVQIGTAWELAAFGISTRSNRYDFFGSKEVRQAIAMCIDREVIVDDLLFGVSTVPDTYVNNNHPLYEPVGKYAYDPGAANDLLSSVGWMDLDGNPGTPRTSSGIANVPDGTPLSFTYHVPADAERPRAAHYIQSGLAGCGIGVEVLTQDWNSLMTPGSEGILFGRNFEMAQFAWSGSVEPACYLFMSDEIPGPYLEYSKGWGGTNLSGYSSPEFDEACRQAMTSLPGSEAYTQAHHRAQAIFAEDLPVLPLYQRIRLVAMRYDFCDTIIDPAVNSVLSHMEEFNYGKICE
jgi:peptide/nickel transport system substrate-binding protein